MRVVYIGSIIFSWHCLQTILDNNLAEVVGIFNVHPDFSANISDYRDQKDLAQKYRISHFWFKNINDDKTVRKMKQLKPDLIMVFGLSQIIREPLLSLPPKGILGTHPALLPKNRGRAAIPWSILKNLKESGLTFMFLTEGTDTGDIVYQKRWRITKRDDAGTIYKKMINTGQQMLKVVLPKLREDKINIKKQPKHSNYWPARKPGDGKISWSKDKNSIEKLVRATTWPYPGAFGFIRGEKLIIWKARAHAGKPEGKVGQILTVSKDSFSVKVKGGVLAISKWEPKDVNIVKGEILV